MLQLANLLATHKSVCGESYNRVQILELGPCRGQICQRSEITTILKQIDTGLFEISPALQRLASKRLQLVL
jgi:hypothetical protein